MVRREKSKPGRKGAKCRILPQHKLAVEAARNAGYLDGYKDAERSSRHAIDATAQVIGYMTRLIGRLT